jgi:hypothetical protein
MSYARSASGPGNIGALKSGIGLTMGPTIGSTDSREAIALGGLGVLSRSQQLNLLDTQRIGFVAATPRKLSRINTALFTPSLMTVAPGTQDLVDTNYIDTTPTSDEIPSEEIVPPEDSGGSTWMWVVGGIVGLGLIGGLAWWALK